MSGFLAALAEQPIFWAVGGVALVFCVGSLFAGLSWRRPDEQTQTCSSCGKYGGGHFDWCPSRFTPDVDTMFAQWREDIDSVPLPAMPEFDAALSNWGRAR